MAINETTDVTQNTTSTLYDNVFNGIVYLEALLIITGNTLTFVAVKQTKKLREIPTNVFILGLAASDGVIGLMTPIFITLRFLKIEDAWSGTVCVLYGPHFSMFWISLLTLLAIAVDRYIAVVQPLSYRQRITTKRAKIISVAIWIVAFSLITSLTCLFGSFGVGSTAVRIVFPKQVSMFFLQIIIFGPVLGNIIIYICIYINLKKKQSVVFDGTRANSEGTHRSTSRTTKAYVNMMALVLVYLLIACVPNYILQAVSKQLQTSKPEWFVYISNLSVILFYSNSFMNPVIYSWKNRNFHQAYKNILLCNRSSGIRSEDSICDGSRTENRSTV
ncbi:hypothetical protein LSH36_1268g00000 [Paralvinella palmiformis]|uniref:G-protein coupled receptors family 1 profile domain-containing protein n=1 Tax=Paralvinella palmiformis TaxID=53620 RepID=A0AAD9IU25_9ANNE|nr:hypothetical protein LSH36_1268g00000 [Paralvinella palmiformis]